VNAVGVRLALVNLTKDTIMLRRRIHGLVLAHAINIGSPTRKTRPSICPTEDACVHRTPTPRR
jgi:hypothetical protein